MQRKGFTPILCINVNTIDTMLKFDANVNIDVQCDWTLTLWAKRELLLWLLPGGVSALDGSNYDDMNALRRYYDVTMV